MTNSTRTAAAPTSTTRAVRAPGVLTAVVGDPTRRPDAGMLLFDPARLRAHTLNRTAAAIWDHLDGGTLTEVADALGTGPISRLDEIIDVVERLAAEGVVRIDDDPIQPPTRVPPGTFANVPHTDQPSPPVDGLTWYATLPGPAAYAALGVRWRIECTDPDLAAYLATVLAPLHVDATAGDAAVPCRRYRVIGDDDHADRRGLITLDDHVVGQETEPSMLAALLLWHVNQLVSTSSRRLLLLHASAVAGGAPGGAIAFPAAMNSGKSTLVAGLVRTGRAYVTDEAVAIDPRTLDVVPYPKAIALDPGSWPHLPDLEPAVDARHTRFTHHKWYVDPEHAGGTIERRTVPLAAVVFPTFRPGGPTTIEPVSLLESASRLANNAFNLATLGQTGVDAIAHIASTVPAWQLQMADLPGAVDAVNEVLATLGP